MVNDGYSYQEQPLPNYTTGGKGANRGLVNVESASSANLGTGWEGANDVSSGGGGGGGGSTVDLLTCEGITVRVIGYALP